MTAVMVATMFVVTASLQLEALRFSNKDVATLREIAAVEGLSKEAASSLLTRAVVDMLSSANRTTFVVYVDSVDLTSSETVEGALPGVDFCEISEIAFVRLRDPFMPPSLAVYRFFDRVRAIASRGCEGTSAGARRKAASIAPYYTPYTVRPRIRNSYEIEAATEREFPKDLREAGLGGMTCVWFYIDRDGRVLRSLIRQSSGRLAMDSAAMRVARIMTFTPALNGDTAVRAWVEFPVWFRVGRPYPGSERYCQG